MTRPKTACLLAIYGAIVGAPIIPAIDESAIIEPPPRRFIAGADAIGTAEQQIAALQQQIDAFRELSSSLAIDEAAAGS